MGPQQTGLTRVYLDRVSASRGLALEPPRGFSDDWQILFRVEPPGSLYRLQASRNSEIVNVLFLTDMRERRQTERALSLGVVRLGNK